MIELTLLDKVFEIISIPINEWNFINISNSLDTRDFLSKQMSVSPLINYNIHLEGGQFKVTSVHSSGIFRVKDEQNFSKGPLIVLPSSLAESTQLFWKEEIDEFEYLINKRDVKEHELQTFFEKNTKFLLNSDYDTLHSGIILQKEDSFLKPDFVMEPVWGKEICDILELKLPNERIITGAKNRKGFSASIQRAIYQLREYHDYFEEPRNRKLILEKYGISAYKPRLYLVIGRSISIEPLLRAKAQADAQRLKLYTYDDLLIRARKRMLY